MNQTLKQIEEEFEKEHWVKILNEYGSLHKKDAKAFLTKSNLRVLEKVKADLMKKIENLPSTYELDEDLLFRTTKKEILAIIKNYL